MSSLVNSLSKFTFVAVLALAGCVLAAWIQGVALSTALPVSLGALLVVLFIGGNDHVPADGVVGLVFAVLLGGLVAAIVGMSLNMIFELGHSATIVSLISLTVIFSKVWVSLEDYTTARRSQLPQVAALVAAVATSTGLVWAALHLF
jgi:hypothetical protein